MLIVLNNKCNFNKSEFLSYQKELANISSTNPIILCPSFLHISNFSLDNCLLGSQNVSKDKNGSHTGEISAQQLKSYGVRYCIIGHSERRKQFQENAHDIGSKIKQLTQEGIIPILCIGEENKEINPQNLHDIIINQTLDIIENLTNQEKEQLIIAYETVWSIGTSTIPSNNQIEEVLSYIKEILPNNKILYGGSVNENNINELKKCHLIDGYLIGGLSLIPKKLQKFIENIEN